VAMFLFSLIVSIFCWRSEIYLEVFLRILYMSSKDFCSYYYANTGSRTGASSTNIFSFLDFLVFGLLFGFESGSAGSIDDYSIVPVYFEDDQFQFLLIILFILLIAFRSSTFITSCTIANFIKYQILSRSKVFQVVRSSTKDFQMLISEKSF